MSSDTLKGQLHGVLVDGRIKGLNLGLALQNVQLPQHVHLKFTQLRGHFRLRHHTVSSDDLTISLFQSMGDLKKTSVPFYSEGIIK